MRPVAKVFVITGPSGVGKGTLIARLLERVPGLELSVSATTRSPRDGRGRRARLPLPRPGGVRAAASPRATSSSTPTYSGNRYGTLRSEVEERLERGRSVVLEIEVQGARQVRDAMPEAVLVFIAPPGPDDLRRAARGAGHRLRGRRSRRG